MGPDVRKHLCITLPPQSTAKLAFVDVVADNMQQPVHEATITLPSTENGNLSDAATQPHFLPIEIESLPHAAKDVIKRLLELEPKQRIRSVLALQKIALYKDFKIDAERLLNASPLDIAAKDNIVLYSDYSHDEMSSALATRAFQDF